LKIHQAAAYKHKNNAGCQKPPTSEAGLIDVKYDLILHMTTLRATRRPPNAMPLSRYGRKGSIITNARRRLKRSR
jgi:hypothetical protein